MGIEVSARTARPGQASGGLSPVRSRQVTGGRAPLSPGRAGTEGGPLPAGPGAGEGERGGERPVLVIRAWLGPEPGGGLWHGPDDDYVLECWVGTLGPSATLAWWHLARRLRQGGTQVLDLADLARALGLGGRMGRSGPLWRALGRLVRFGAARFVGPVMEVRLVLADLSAQALARSSGSARRYHAATLARRSGAPGGLGRPGRAGPGAPPPTAAGGGPPVAALQARAEALRARATGSRIGRPG